jgi:hypothetical protein
MILLDEALKVSLLFLIVATFVERRWLYVTPHDYRLVSSSHFAMESASSA